MGISDNLYEIDNTRKTAVINMELNRRHFWLDQIDTRKMNENGQGLLELCCHHDHSGHQQHILQQAPTQSLLETSNI